MENTNEINIKGIDKVALLKALWENMYPASFFEKTGKRSPSFNENEAATAVKRYIDYFYGRCIKTDISGDTADPQLYDRDAGEGAFKKIVDGLN